MVFMLAPAPDRGCCAGIAAEARSRRSTAQVMTRSGRLGGRAEAERLDVPDAGVRHVEGRDLQQRLARARVRVDRVLDGAPLGDDRVGEVAEAEAVLIRAGA